MADVNGKTYGEGSVENVAFKVFGKISDAEKSPSAAEARQYYLKLYSDCLAAVKGYPV